MVSERAAVGISYIEVSIEERRKAASSPTDGKLGFNNAAERRARILRSAIHFQISSVRFRRKLVRPE